MWRLSERSETELYVKATRASRTDEREDLCLEAGYRRSFTSELAGSSPPLNGFDDTANQHQRGGYRICAYLMNNERLRVHDDSGIISVQLTGWFWLAFLSSLAMIVTALAMLLKRQRAP